MPLPDRKNLNPWRNSRFQVEHILSKILNGSGRVALSPKVRSPSTPKNSCANRIARIFQISLQTRIIDNTRIKWYTLHYINLNISILMRSNSDWFLSFFFLIHFSQTVEHRRIKGRLIFNFISSTLSTNKDGPYTSNKCDLSEAYRSKNCSIFIFIYPSTR